jgi:hypothetical protein
VEIFAEITRLCQQNWLKIRGGRGNYRGNFRAKLVKHVKIFEGQEMLTDFRDNFNLSEKFTEKCTSLYFQGRRTFAKRK